MRNIKTLLFILLSALIFIPAKAQQNEIDSLKKVLLSQADDSAKVKTLIHLSHVIANSDGYDGMDYAIQAKNLSEKLGYKWGSAISFTTIAWLENIQGNYEEGLQNYMKAVELNKEIDDNSQLSFDYIGIGKIYLEMGNYPDALKNFLQAEELIKKLSDKHRLGTVYNNISTVYLSQDNFDKAIEYAVRAKQEAEYMNDKNAKASAINMLGTIYQRKNEDDAALQSFNEALAIYDTIGEKSGMADEELNIGNIYRSQMNLAESVKWYQKAGLAAKEIESSSVLRDVYHGLADNYKSMGKYEDALSYYTLYTTLNDSLLSDDMSRKISQMEMKSDNEKKELLIKKEKEQLEKLSGSSDQRKGMLILIGCMVILALAFLIYIVIAYQKISNLKSTIENERALNFNKFQKPGNRGNMGY